MRILNITAQATESWDEETGTVHVVQICVDGHPVFEREYGWIDADLAEASAAEHFAERLRALLDPRLSDLAQMEKEELEPEARPIGFAKHNGCGEVVFRQAGHPSNDPGGPWRPVYLHTEEIE